MIRLFLIGFFMIGQIPLWVTHAETIYGYVTRISGGDTLYLNNKDGKFTVKLAAIASPGFGHDFIGEAWSELKKELLHEAVRVDYTITDVYGVITGDVYLRKRWINSELIERSVELFHYYNSPDYPPKFSFEDESPNRKHGKGLGFSTGKHSRDVDAAASPSGGAKTDKKFKPQRKSLEEIRGLYVTISPIPSRLQSAGYSEEQILVDTEQRLKKYGITLLSPNSYGSANLDIQINLIPSKSMGTYAMVELKVYDERAAGRKVNKDRAAVWELGSISLVGDSGFHKIDGSLESKTNFLIDDFLSAHRQLASVDK